MGAHGTQQSRQPLPPLRRRCFHLVIQDRRRLVDPGEGRADLRPQRGGRRQAALRQFLQSFELARQPLFCSTRSRLAATALSRSCSCSPDASRGGRPSSVRALRTALQ
jgi:hypothetical protein